MRQVIILETNINDGGFLSVRCAMWFPVTAGQEVARPGFVSVLRGAAVPTAQEATDLQDGKVVEDVLEFKLPRSMTQTQVKNTISAAWTDRKAYLDSLPFEGQWYGRSWDGTVWNA